MKKTKKVRTYEVNGEYVLSKKKKLKSNNSTYSIISVTLKDLERLYLYAIQREKLLAKTVSKELGCFVVRLSSDVGFIVDNRRKK